MLSFYSINLAELSKTEKLIFLGVFVIMLVLGIIDYFYQKHKDKKK